MLTYTTGNHSAEGTGSMGIREKLASNSKLMVGLALALVMIAVGYTVWSNSSDIPTGPLQAFYTVDDGKTYFAEDAIKLVPFDKDGKQAVRAHVYECAHGKKFVASLERMSPEAKAIIDKMKATGEQPDTPTQMKLAEGGTQFKRPGETNWTTRNEFNKAFVLTCPDGTTGNAQLVIPD